jgi:hypothetical protein
MFTFLPAVANHFRRASPVAVIAALSLAACGGGSGYGSGYSSTSPTGAAGSKAFAADSPHSVIGSLINPNPGPGTIMVDRTIMGIYTQLSNNIGSLALDTGNDRLYVGNGTSILVFNGASQANGDPFVDRVITNSPASGNTGSLFLDTVGNRLYVGDDVVGVRVFDNASGITGATASTRVITGDFGASFQIFGVAVDIAKNILFVSNRNITASSSQISVFDSASTVSGSNTPNRTITPNPASTVGGIFLDAGNNRLYVAGGSSTAVMVFDNASTANGSTQPTKTMSFPSAITSVVVDTVNDRLYAVSLGAIYILNGASTASGAVTANAVLAPSGGSFTAVAVAP